MTVCLVIWSTVFAGEPLSVDDAHPVSQGMLELESGLQWSRIAGEPHLDARFSLALGLPGDVELGATLGGHLHEKVIDYSAKSKDVLGISDLGFGLKWNVLSGEKWVASILPAIVFPAAEDAKGLACDQAFADLTTAASLSIGRLACDVNLGYVTNGATWRYGVAARYLWQENLELVAETFGENAPDCAALAEVSAGFIYQLRPSLSLFLGVGRSVTSDGSEVVVKSGVVNLF